ncbi:MAG: hypothetical protein IJR63_11005 [Synergistaceae bacterium]|nr:hypothetical protein [Synergistaceae bacterium]
MIKSGRLHLVTSYILTYENSRNPFSSRRNAIEKFIRTYSSYHVGADKAGRIKHVAKSIMSYGVRMKDAYHVACALEDE